jgi:hypothetical protein
MMDKLEKILTELREAGWVEYLTQSYDEFSHSFAKKYESKHVCNLNGFMQVSINVWDMRRRGGDVSLDVCINAETKEGWWIYLSSSIGADVSIADKAAEKLIVAFNAVNEAMK